MIRVQLKDEERKQLVEYRQRASAENSERALMVLMNYDGASAEKIAETLKRHPHTVRTWLKRYQGDGIAGLTRKYAPGPSDKLRQSVKKELEPIIDRPPSDLGYPLALWSVALMQDYLAKRCDIKASEDTIERSLRDLGYSYHRSAKSTPENAPSKEDKRAVIHSINQKISRLVEKEDCEIFALDESHFSTEPYVVSGWGKKGHENLCCNTKKSRKIQHVWLLQSGEQAILLEDVR